MEASQTPPGEVPTCLRASWAQALVEAVGRSLRARTGDARPAPAASWEHRPGFRAVPVVTDQLDDVDGDAVAQWVVDQYPDVSYRTVVIGSAHGSTAHLAAAMGAPWLPTGFQCDVLWSDARAYDADAALDGGRAIASVILSWNHGLGVRQIYDPIRLVDLPARELTFHLRWRELPPAYVEFLDQRLVPGGSVVVVADERAWFVLDPALPMSFQLGTPTSGLTWDRYRECLTRYWPERAPFWPNAMQAGTWDGSEAELGIEPGFVQCVRDWAARTADHRVMVVGYKCASQWSAAVADVYRRWLRSMGRDADRLIVECGRLLDPSRVLLAGLVPYWCEGSTIAALDGAELWLAAHRPFTQITLRPDPTGLERPRIAELSHWHGLGAFAARPRAWPDLLVLPGDADPSMLAMPRLSVRGLIIGLRTLAMNHPDSDSALSRLETWAAHLPDERAVADG